MEQNSRNPTEQKVREWLIKDITDRLTAAANLARAGRYKAAVRKKEEADALIIFGSARDFLEEADRRTFYGTRPDKNGAGGTPGIFPEELEAKARKMLDWDLVQSEVDRRMYNLIDRMRNQEGKREAWEVYKKMPKGER